MKNQQKRRKIDGGELCPKCWHPMQRFEHAGVWKPKSGQPYYFAYWDRCKPCGHTQMYEAAKVALTRSGDMVAADG